MRQAFISHSSTEDRYAAEMVSFLRGIMFDEVFNDGTSIQPDELFWPEIEKAIANCDTFIVIITAASNASKWVRREVEYARSLSKNIIPVRIEDCPVPSEFVGRDIIDFRPGTRAKRRFEVSVIIKHSPAKFSGRTEELTSLNEAWGKALRGEKCRPHVLAFFALGGEGKTSLVAKWIAGLAHQGWPGWDAAFAWSFHGQDTHERSAPDSDLFLKKAVNIFGDHADKQFIASEAGAFEKGQRLAHLIGQQRALLILDGLESLQFGPNSSRRGFLKDQCIEALLKGLATASKGLCIVTTRYSMPDLRAFWQMTASEVKLPRLPRADGVDLLLSCGVKGTPLRHIAFQGEKLNEVEKLVEDSQGHALTLSLVGTYLRDSHAGDILKRDLVKLEEADAEEQGGRVFRVVEAYERTFEREGGKGRRALAMLRLLGLFNQSITSDCFDALLQPPAISGLTAPLVNLDDAQRNLVLKRLEDAQLLTANYDRTGVLITIDAHPLVCEYSARRLRKKQPATWRAANRRLYEYLCANTHEGDQPTLEDLQPLYKAVFHGCQAGLYPETYEDLYFARIQRRQEYYSTNKLGAHSAVLRAIICFYDKPWTNISPRLTESIRAELLSETAFSLSALGRQGEASHPRRSGLAIWAGQKNWLEAAKSAINLTELEISLGEIPNAIKSAQLAVDYADLGKMPKWSSISRVRLAASFHEGGYRREAEKHFQEAELLHAEIEPEYPLLYTLRGFQYCELLLGIAERAAWKIMLKNADDPSRIFHLSTTSQSSHAGYSQGVVPTDTTYSSAATVALPLIKQCHEAAHRAGQSLRWANETQRHSLLHLALDHLTLGRASIYTSILGSNRNDLEAANPEVDASVDAALCAAHSNHLPRVLLTRAWLSVLTTSVVSSQVSPVDAADILDEAWEIAARSNMKLFLADVYLYRVRLFFKRTKYPWESPQADLILAEKLIGECGYHRRDEELADAKNALQSR